MHGSQVRGNGLNLFVRGLIAVLVCWSLSIASASERQTCSNKKLLMFLRAAVDDVAALQRLSPNAVPTHKVWRLNVPGSSSSNLLEAIKKGTNQTWRQRLQLQGSANTTTGATSLCHDQTPSVEVRGCSWKDFRAAATFVAPASQSQHADYKYFSRFLRKHGRNAFVYRTPEPGQQIMVRVVRELLELGSY